MPDINPLAKITPLLEIFNISSRMSPILEIIRAFAA
jgi:hypothetical protein